MVKAIILCLLFNFAGFFLVHSQNPAFKRISNKEGLSNSWVRCFYQDDLGFIWIGTSDGLNRYDGKQVKVFRPTALSGINLGNITVNSIIKQNDSLLWIGTDGGLFSFNIIREKMTLDTLLPPHPVLCITKDHQNQYWFGTNNGLFSFNNHDKQLQHFTSNHPESPLSNNYINTLYADSYNNLWVGTKGGLNRFNRARNIFEITGDAQLKTNEDIRCIYEDRQKQLWIGTAHNGLKKLNQQSSNLQFIHVLDGAISAVYADAKNTLWVAHSDESGILLLESGKSNQKTPFNILKNDPLDQQSLSDNAVFCFFEDQTGDLWIGTYGNGINYFSPRAKAFWNVTEQYNKERSIYNNLVNCFFDEKDYLWIGTEGGLDRLDKKTGKFKHFSHEPGNNNSLASNPVLSIFKDSNGNLWVGTWSGGLHRFNYQNHTFKRYLPDGKPGSLGSGNVSAIIEDQQQRLWVGTVSGGLNLYDPANEKFKTFRKNPDDPTTMAGRSINDLLIKSDGKMYIALYSSVDRYNESNNSFEHLLRNSPDSQYQPASITALFEDSRNNLWLATNAGLELLDSAGNIARVYTSANGLPDNTIQSILEDKHGNLWLSTNRGIVSFTNGIHAPDNPNFQHFTIADGLLSNNFKSRAALKNNDGYFYFGSLNGYTWFHPDSIHMNTLEPKIVFTSLEVQYASPNAYTSYKPYNINLNFSSSVDLKYPNTNFIIGFAALNYLNSAENQYQYKLEGYDTEWVKAGNSTTATYTNIPEGTYRFLVTGSNNDGVWSQNPASITIVIHPAWWQSFLFKFMILVIVFLISLSIIAIRFISLSRTNLELEARVNKRTMELTRLNHLLEEKNDKIIEQNIELEKHQNHLEKLVADRTIELEEARIKAEESNRLKSAFLANMSHEIRTPMNAIIGFSSMLTDAGLSDEKREKYIQQVKTNGNNLNVLINDIIDISLIEARQLVLHATTFDAGKILTELYQIFQIENRERFSFIYDQLNDPMQLLLTNDAHRFRQIMVNLLSNAFKYSEQGSIHFGFEIYETEVQFYVKDEGIGIASDELENIFKHFYKSDKNKSKLYRGTGIGLAICQNLVSQMGGKIWVESEVHKGSTFYFTLPVKK